MNAIGAYGYALVGVLYFLFTVLLLTAWRGRRVGIYLIAASLVSVVWSGTLALHASGSAVSPMILFVVEVFRFGAWIAFIGRLLIEVGASPAIRNGANAIWLTVLIAGPAYAIAATEVGIRSELGLALIWGGLLTALTGLVLIEQLYRNASQGARWSLKLLVLALGGMFTYDLFLFSQAAMFNAIDSTVWIARGPVNVLFVPLIAVAARRNPDWQLRIFISRHVAFYTTMLTAIGLYLIMMSAGGYLILRYGGDWGGVLRVVFLVGAGVVLVTLLFSNTLRARLRVFLSKHFFQNKYDYREEWLRLISTLSRFEDSSTRAVVIEAMAQIVASPAGLLWIRDERSGEFRLSAKYGTDEEAPDLPADNAVGRFIERDGWLIDLNEFRSEPDLYGNLELPEWLDRFRLAWLIVPVMHARELIGLVLLCRAPGDPKLNFEDRDLLKTVGNHIGVLLAQEKSDRQLAEAKQFETYNRLTAFLMHDLNNLIAQQSLIVSNAEKHKQNPAFVDDAIRTIAGSVDRMKRVMRTLKSGVPGSAGKATDLRFIVSAAVDRCLGNRPVPELELNGVDVQVNVNAEEFSMVLSHLIRNAQDACEEDGHVTVVLDHEADSVTVTIVDDGTGMSPEFVRERLFRPFDSTKGSQGMGIGAYQAREFARRLGGDLTVRSTEGAGTRVALTVPVEKSRKIDTRFQPGM